MNKKVVFVIPAYSPDLRTAKFIRCFIDKDFEIHVLRYNARVFNNYDDIVDVNHKNIHVYNIKAIFPSPNIPFNLFRDLKIMYYIKKINPDLVICRDIFLSTFLNNISKKLSSKTRYVLDICDNYPEVAKNLFRDIIGKVLWLILNYVEKRALKFFDHIIFVSEYSYEYICRKHNVDGINYSIVYNVPLRVNTNNIICNGKRKGVVYIGTIDKGIRDLDTVIKAIKYLKDSYNLNINFDVYYFKSDQHLVNFYKKMCEEYKINEQVNFKEAVKHSILFDVLKKYKIGIVPHCRSEAVDFTIPNKIFDYAQCGLAVLVSDNPALKGLVEKYKIGLIYKGGDCIDCANKIVELDNIYEDKKFNFVNPQIMYEELCWEKFFKNFYEKMK